MTPRHLIATFLLLWLAASPAQASSQLALDKGCYSCHGDPPRRGAPGMAQLAADYARYRGQADAPRRLADKLREGGLFAHIAAHERISQEECEALMRWIIEGAK
jgi:cytochrome c